MMLMICYTGLERRELLMLNELGYLALTGIDVDAVLRQKMEYNVKRPSRHGGKEF